MSISATGNAGIGTISPTAQLHTTGSVRLAGLPDDSTSEYPRALVSDSSGNLAYRSTADLAQTVGGGLGITGTDSLTLGDSVAGPGTHSFTANRYQNLNSYYYSIGGSVNDPVNAANFRWYNNGDLVSGTTMDRSVNTEDQTGLRYYSKIGVLGLGASDRLDTVRGPIITATWQGSGLSINSDDSNYGGPKLINSIFLSDLAQVDTSVTLSNSLLGVESSKFYYPASVTNSLINVWGGYFENLVCNSAIFGQSNVLTYPVNGLFLGCILCHTSDTSINSMGTGIDNYFGGVGQLVGGTWLYNPTPFGSVLGNGNVNFSTLSYTGTQGLSAPGISGYPLLAIGNSPNVTPLPPNATPSNALTVLYNGRTQINTTGYSTALSQTAVTPKAALEVVSTNTGVLFPLLTAAEQRAIDSTDLQTGLLLYNSDAACYQFYTGSVWQPLGFAGGLSGEWQNLGNTGLSPASNFIGTTDAEPLTFRTDNTQQMTITAGGTVGIGTSTPQTNARLAVNGTIYAQKIEATQTGWPDFVFEPGYSLMPLPSLRQYIRQHRQLPGMIAASAAAETGVDLGDNQAVLLQKIEELTLYLIEAQAKAAAREKEIDRLQAVSSRLEAEQRELANLQAELEELLHEKK